QLHLHHVQDIFTRLIDANLRLKIEKCNFGCSEVSYLGYRVGRDGLKSDPDKVMAVTKLARPETKKDIRRFLGMAGYYRSMIRNFSTIAAPLHEMTKNINPEKLRWSESAEASFQGLKQALTTHPVLKLPNFKSGVLMQVDEEGRNRPVAFTSRLTKPAEKNYSVYDLELLAYDFSIQWRRGSSNKVADALSRLSPEIDISDADFPKELSDHEEDAEEREAYEKNQEMDAETAEDVSFIEKCTGDSICNGMLVHYYDTVGEFRRRVRRVQVVVPGDEEIRRKLLLWAHNMGCGAHVGTQKAFATLRSHYWFRNMYTHLVKLIRECEQCQRLKNPLGRLRARPGPCRRPMPRGPMDTIHIDAMTICKTTCVIMVCSFSKWPEIYISPRKDLTGSMLAEAFLRKIVCRWGVPRQVITDRIAYQTSGVFPELCRLLGIKLSHTTSYNSQANGAVESKVRACKMLIRSVAREYPHRWKQLMSLCLLVYRCSFHRAIGDTPFHICTGR
ncbi:unnamed protein product, partial [Heterosigma akashiwo]